MKIRRARTGDIDSLLGLLGQVLEIHAHIRPDIFISGTTKYTEEDLRKIIADDDRPIFVAVDDKDTVMGYAFCMLKKQPFTTTMVPFTSMFIDDLCVDQRFREQRVGMKLFEYVKEKAKELDCYEISLNVWEGNECAQKFYDKMGMKVKETQMEYIL
ncbi:GNAT family N-acetyltransferase [Butyrivibrio sp. VCB2006]|uniref:GNAT family N-acetyltransferase n=1 Tax=Butyrivibrio sp. VCB2006 TaxID=1280679 RepID=UPI00040B6466|nr:GNAT family N-acetyltransferase [Butyrivibrio sp. VCB2006]